MKHSNPLNDQNIIDNRITFVANKMKENPELVQKIYRLVKIEVNKETQLDPVSIITQKLKHRNIDHSSNGILKYFISAINETPGDYNDVEMFLKTFGEVSYVDTAKLMKSGNSTWDNWLTGADKVNPLFIRRLYDNLFDIKLNISGSNRGPGEIGLVLLSPNISFAQKGDLIIDGVEVEVKGESSKGGGRLKNSNDDFGLADLGRVYNEFNIPADQMPARLPTGAPNSKGGRFFKDIAERLDGISKGAGTAYIRELFEKTYIPADPALKVKMINNWNKMDRYEIANLAYSISYSNYANIIKEKGFDHFLFLKKTNKTSLVFKTDDYQQYLNRFKMQSLDWADKINGAAVQVTMK